jgi:hypothetical protein
MMGLSLGKLLFTVAIIVIVWKVFQAITRRGAAKPRVNPAQRAARMAEDTVRSRMDGAAVDRGGGDAIDMVRCPSCGAFTAPGSTCQCGWKAPG